MLRRGFCRCCANRDEIGSRLDRGARTGRLVSRLDDRTGQETRAGRVGAQPHGWDAEGRVFGLGHGSRCHAPCLRIGAAAGQGRKRLCDALRSAVARFYGSSDRISVRRPKTVSNERLRASSSSAMEIQTPKSFSDVTPNSEIPQGTIPS